jgi:ATP-dependent helicase/DNAse subunit B
MITVAAGDVAAVTQMEKRGARVQLIEEGEETDLTQLARYLFSKEPPPQRTRSGELLWFSAPGEGRECVEIARRILKEADRGVSFDEIAIVIRPVQQYVGVLEHALTRAGIPAYFQILPVGRSSLF